MNLTCYKTHSWAPELVPGRSTRDWMDKTMNRFAYRCIPLTAANALGWELINPETFSVTWTGGPGLQEIIFRGNFPKDGQPHYASSHFGTGIITFHPGYLFRTDPGWGIMCKGPPNWGKDGIYPLEGYIETDWLPFTFTMNWQFTRPGTVTFEKGEPFCFINLIQADILEQTEPVIRELADNPELHDEYKAWSASRQEFNKNLEKSTPEQHKHLWQKFYVRGKAPTGSEAPETHKSKRAAKPPKSN